MARRIPARAWASNLSSSTCGATASQAGGSTVTDEKLPVATSGRTPVKGEKQ